jgi:hypothetical protein
MKEDRFFSFLEVKNNIYSISEEFSSLSKNNFELTIKENKEKCLDLDSVSMMITHAPNQTQILSQMGHVKFFHSLQ